MKAHDNGSFYSVTVSADDVRAFKSKWPGSNLPTRSIWFQFSKRNDDLVDIQPHDIDGQDALALSQDAQAYGKKKLNLEEEGA